jgi:hypothetical protein
MNTIQSKIMTNANFEKYPDDKYALRLMKDIVDSKNVVEVINAFVSHSKSVANGETASDYLNGCDGESSPLSIFVYELLSVKNLTFYNEFLDTIKTEDDYNNCEWILCEINTLLWTNPVQYSTQIILYIMHDIIGPHFSFWSAIWVNGDYYENKELGLHIIDELYLVYLQTYENSYRSECKSRFRYEYTTITNAITNEARQKRNFISPFTFSQYLKEVENDLMFRHLTEKELPKLYQYINNYNLTINDEK